MGNPSFVNCTYESSDYCVVPDPTHPNIAFSKINNIEKTFVNVGGSKPSDSSQDVTKINNLRIGKINSSNLLGTIKLKSPQLNPQNIQTVAGAAVSAPATLSTNAEKLLFFSVTPAISYTEVTIDGSPTPAPQKNLIYVYTYLAKNITTLEYIQWKQDGESPIVWPSGTSDLTHVIIGVIDIYTEYR